jgi:hypothetical protein
MPRWGPFLLIACDNGHDVRTKILRKSCWPLLAALTAWGSAGCTATFTNPGVKAGEEHTEWSSYFLVGAIGKAEVDVRDYCPTGRAQRVRFGENLATLGVSLITIGIYTPRRVVVTCEAVEARR